MRGQPLRRIEGSHRYGAVLGVILVPIVFSLAAPDELWARVTTAFLFATSIFITLAVSHAKRWVQILAFGLVILVLVTAIVDVVVGSEVSQGAGRAAIGLMIALAPFSLARGVMRHLREEGQVTLDAVYGAIAIYLLLGAFFATIDAAVGSLQSHPFFNQVSHAGFQDYLYFSYVTLSTVGYGDFTPATSLARTLAITEALSGQLYLVTVVAVLVSNVKGRGRRGSGDDDVSGERPPPG